MAFAYANDLWVADVDGSGVRRLTAHPGVESGPRFSPDGTLVAFTGRYEGNTDVYVVPAAGGVPKRLTYHPGDDVALGFTPDGKSVLFSSAREVYTGRYTQLFTVPVEGGFPTRLPIPNASKAQISPDGKTTAYVPLVGGLQPVEALPRRQDSRGSCSSTTPATPSSRSPSRPAAATTPTRCGSGTGSTSAPTATASSTCTPSTARRRPSRG